MQLFSIALIAVGFVALAWGMPAAHRLATPWDILTAFAALCGLVALLLGTLLAVVPGFFG
ncbi:hypothetical protein KI811_10875 [Geobacter hydrogenophilus]|uniref:Uncharacterized protein n=1 Tax=Geobacter hydrogenophilus TaxID=40983 RepID=A0A9W6G101_9BACT|nr:hypothetical protein [Geobacter hydrogenophilus]MBT0894310.1 hypothetical protein [Geobacter hydrogenophilus]GLI38403.1 hypothetical protein GHYDROH2_19040 [Geobacter hydrogenophilus]